MVSFLALPFSVAALYNHILFSRRHNCCEGIQNVFLAERQSSWFTGQSMPPTYGHELWVMTEQTNPQVEAAETSMMARRSSLGESASPHPPTPSQKGGRRVNRWYFNLFCHFVLICYDMMFCISASIQDWHMTDVSTASINCWISISMAATPPPLWDLLCGQVRNQST